ncbi:MAG: M20/M25/M40 family metallo-hydrolase [Planctomycetota bacterium]
MAKGVPQSVIELLQMMVRVNTVNRALPGSCDAESMLVDQLGSVATVWGLQVKRLAVEGQSDQLLLTHCVDHDQPWLMFDSHLDTVSVEGMTIDPFSAEVKEGKVWGRGSCDTKGTGAAMLWAMKEAVERQAEQPLLNNLALLFSVDEEVSMRGVASFVKQDLASLGWSPAAVVVGEPTEMRPVIAHNGCIRWSLTTHGKACHSSVPHEGVSAISAMVRIIDLIESKYIPSLKAEHPLTGPAVCSINMIQGGSAPNIIPDRCTIEIDRRIVPGEDLDQAIADIHASLEPLTAGDSPVQFTQEVVVGHPAFGIERNGPWVDHLVSVLVSLGMSKLTLGAPFATHAAYFDQAQIPAVVLGPGSPHTAHTKDEWVAVDQIERGVELYRAIMQAPLAAMSS